MGQRTAEAIAAMALGWRFGKDEEVKPEQPNVALVVAWVGELARIHPW